MSSLRYDIYKEWIEAVRTKKLMVLGIVLLFFSLLDPVMLRLTPYLLEELGGINIGDMIQLTQIAQMKEYQADIYQLFTIVLVVVLGNVWLNEVKQETLIIPVSKGLKLSSMMFAKILVYSLYLNVILIIGYSINYYYSGIIFGFGVAYYQVLISALMMGMFYLFVIVLILALSPIVYNFPGVIFISLVVVFGGPFLMSLLKVEVFTPFGLLSEAALFPRLMNENVYISIASMMLSVCVLYYLGVYVANKKEIVKYR